VRDHQCQVGGRVGGQRREFLGDLLARVLGIADDHDRRGIEQGGSGDVDQLAGPEAARGHLPHAGRAVTTRGGDQAGDGPIHEQFLVPGDHAHPGATPGNGRDGPLGFTHGHGTQNPMNGGPRWT